MAFELKGRKVNMFRCHLDPAIGPASKNAFSKKMYPNMEAELTPVGVYVKFTLKVPGNAERVTEHLVPYANVQSIQLEEPEMKDDGQRKDRTGKEADSGEPSKAEPAAFSKNTIQSRKTEAAT